MPRPAPSRSAAALDLQVTAEGVETPEQWQMLAALGDPELQGFLFSRPLLSEALKAFRTEVPDAGERSA